MNKRRWILWGIIAALVAFAAYKLATSSFDWAGFWHACRSANWRMLLISVVLIWINCLSRAIRWAIFLKPVQPEGQRTPWYKLIGAQFIGFTGLAIFGRIGEFIRPYLIARRTSLTFASQIAVVAVERIFDLGAFAIIFSLNLAFASDLTTLPHHEYIPRIGWALVIGCIGILAFVTAVRVSGNAVANVTRKLLGLLSAKLGDAVADKLLSFREGLNTIQSAKDLVYISLHSVLMWASIAAAYVFTIKAFPVPLADLSISRIIILMGFSVGGSIIQLPGVGGGPQALSIFCFTLLFGVPKELASACAIVLYVINTMSVIPIGLVYARAEGVSLSSVTKQSEEAGEAIEA